jgi:hypothetical protein
VVIDFNTLYSFMKVTGIVRSLTAQIINLVFVGMLFVKKLGHMLQKSVKIIKTVMN